MKTLALDLPGSFDPGLNICRGFSKAVIAELLVIHTGDLDMNIDAVKQGTRDTFLIPGDGG
jgi:hypothetical protein